MLAWIRRHRLLPELIPAEELGDVFAQVALLAYTVDCVLEGIRKTREENRN